MSLWYLYECACVCAGRCLSGSRETLLREPELLSSKDPCFGLQLRPAGVQSFRSLGGEGWLLGFLGNLFIPAIK